MRPDTDLVVERNAGRWMVAAFAGPVGNTPRLAPLGSYRLKVTASAVAVALAKNWLSKSNSRGACEVYWRGRDGQITDRNTYGRDPERSKG